MSEGMVRVRFAPSPTGYPHIGNIRTALFNWLFARHSGGSFIVRIEDTDVTRKVEGALEAILDGLRWLGIDWDEGPEKGGDYGPYFQSERRDLYHRYAQQLLEGGHAYKCYCSPERLAQMRAEMARRKESMRSYDRHCRNLRPEEQAQYESQGITPVIRFKVPLDGQTTFHDLIRGDITFDNNELDDIVLLKSDGYPTYHLANVVDDHLMRISHVLRADEWLSSTPRHILLYNALGYEPPLFAHLPMILGSDRSKLSKRHGATSIVEYREQGYVPQAMMNFLALLGWSLDDKTEIFSVEELVRHFSLERISKPAAIFSHDKLTWMNGVYIRNMSIAELREQLLPFLERDLPREVKKPISREYVQQITPLIQERLTTFGETAEHFSFFFVDKLIYDPNLLLGKKLTRETAMAGLEAALGQLQDLPFDASSLELTLRPLASELGLKTGDFFGLLRAATTGRTATPPLFQTMAVLGRERCLERIEAALNKLQDNT
ncbi:MAG: glutamate--tRNA ligase [Dehalococcoidia bacterium]|nr:glutamate--tRNA ligase [Dehalococcoidia bacterium]